MPPCSMSDTVTSLPTGAYFTMLVTASRETCVSV